MIEKKYLVIISIIIFFTSLIAISLNAAPYEISNNVTLIVEIGVGFIIAVTIYGITRKSETEIENKINNMSSIVEDRENFRKEQENSAKNSLLKIFNELKTDVIQVLHDVKDYEKHENSTKKEFYKKRIIASCKQIKSSSEKNLDDSTIISHEIFGVVEVAKFKTLSNLCKNEPVFDDEGGVDIDFCNKIKKIIEPWIVEFSQKLEKKKEVVISEQIKLEDDANVVSISVSSDRTVYPLDSIMHIRANIETLIAGEKILFEIFNSKRKLLLSQKINPETYDHLGLRDSNIFQVSFKMEGNEWKVGDEYIVRATYSSSYSEDSFLIDQRMPVIQSDKSVYTINSDVILTVIDPDADKDNEIVEFVGDREDSKLIIESPYGKIDGYKLRETGDSTGIFQGILGILGVQKDDSIIERKVGDKIIKKTQGTGIDDGFIAGPPGQEITITYKNSTASVKLSIFVSNFGAALELDQKVYTWTDKVYITLVAPDFINCGTQHVDILTNEDKILNYELKETDKDTGIFTGQIRLTGKNKFLSNHKKYNRNFFGTTKGNGPNNGLIACGNDDGIQVSFRLSEKDHVVANALVRWNIAEVQWLDESYPIDGVGKIRVVDPDMNLNPDEIDTLEVKVWSDSDIIKKSVILHETNIASGIFEGEIKLDPTKSNEFVLHVSEGDTIIAEYVDFTLPDPYTSSDELQISGSAVIETFA